MTQTTGKNRVEREATLRWVPIGLMTVSPLAQREVNQARVDHLVATFDLEKIGTPTVNRRDGVWYIIDGQHRVEACRAIGWGDQQIQCWAYEGLTEAEEAEKFLGLNDYLAVNALAKFRVAVQAGRDVECDVDRIVRACGLVVSRDKVPGAVGAVGTLLRVYERSGPAILRQTLIMVRDAYGDSGMESAVIDGLGLFCQRYASEMDPAAVVSRLSSVHGGVNGLLGAAEILRKQTGNYKNHCVAAAAVDIVNRGRGGKKLPSWWREDSRSLAAVPA
jgi:hypothetical protein